jgi:serine/threonine-protein kinase
VAAADLVGRPVDEVQAELVGRGLQVELVPVETADVAAGMVTAVGPEGELPPGAMVTVTYAVAPAVTQAPAQSGTATAGTGTGTSGAGNNGRGNGNGHGHGRGKG